MKKYVFILCVLLSCNKKPDDSTSTKYPEGIKVVNNSGDEECSSNDCDQNKTLRLIAKDAIGIISFDSLYLNDVYKIRHSLSFDSYMQIYPCNLPEKYKINRLKIKYSGNMYDACGTRAAVWPVEEAYILDITDISEI